MTELIQVLVTDRDGQEHRLQAPVGTVLMELLRDAELGVEAVCGGCCACATCHVYVAEPEIGSRGDLELALVGATDAFLEAHSRLSCQIELSHEFDNLQLQIAPED